MNQAHTPAVIAPSPADNSTQLLLDRLANTPDLEIFSLPDGSGWKQVTVREFHQQVVALAKGFIAAGIEPGQRVGIMCKTRYEWTLIDFAMWFAGGVLVPIYETSSPSQIEWILSDSGATTLIVETADHAGRFAVISERVPQVNAVHALFQNALTTLVEAGKKISDDEVEQRRSIAKSADVATLIYTSGSTGRPKGVVLTHGNFVETSRNASIALASVLDGGSMLLFITIAHVYARFIAVMCVNAGVRVGHQADTTKLLQSLASFKPTFILAVPRVFEKVYNSSEQKAEAGGKGAIFRAAAATAIAHSKAKESGRVSIGLALKFALFDRLVLSKLRIALGGNVKYAVSGSAPLGERLGHFYHSLGIKILEGYGLTETTAPASVCLPESFTIGTVGPPLPGVSIRIAEDGEIEIRGVNIFKEYWQNPEATAEAFTADGYFKTGDVGVLDAAGNLKITGRKKEIIVTAGGKNVSPAFLEDPIRANPLIGQVVVVGDQKPFIAALVTLDPEMLPTWLANNGESETMSLAEAAIHPKIREEVQHAIDQANSRVSRAESIRKFSILPIEFTEASGHLTPKLSIKRNVILNDFAAEIAALYGGVTEQHKR